MGKLKDYSGELRKDLHLCDFDREFVTKLLDEWCAAYVEGVFELLGKDEKLSRADKNHIVNQLWIQVEKRLMPRLAKLANIKVKTVLDSFKVSQLCLEGITMNSKGKRINQTVEFKNPNHMILTMNSCPFLQAREEAGAAQEELEEFPKTWCAQERLMFEEVLWGYMLDNVTIKALKLPPRRSKDSPPCIWEITKLD
jgi:hypothetical protein